MTDAEPDVRNVSLDDMFGEMRRRQVQSWQVLDELGHPPEKRHWSERTLALITISILTAGLIGVVSWIAIDGSEVPDFLAALTGTGLGSIAGILTGGSLGNNSQRRQEP
jgi:hypothetical protein